MKRSAFTMVLAGLVLMAGLGFAVLSLSRPMPVDAGAMTAANELVAAGHYAEAAQMYEQLIAKGAQDAAPYYNLGNAALLLGDAGRAAAAYERAAALAPRDPDIRANLALAERQARDQANSEVAQHQTRAPGNLPVAHQPSRVPAGKPSAGLPGGLADLTGRWLTVDELALLALGAWLALGLLVFTYRGLQQERRPALVKAAVVLAFVVVLATGGALAGRLAAPQLAAPPAIPGQPPAGTDGQRVAAPAGVLNPS
jgi:tetratricopeptide (TPR) repeat protein